MILSNQDIITSIETGKLEVRYGLLAVGKDGAFVEHSVAPADKWTAESQRTLRQSIVRNRLGLHVGPLLKRLSGPHVKSKFRYSGFRDIHDLRKGPFEIWPNQSVVVAVNEWMKLGNTRAGIIFSRVFNFSVGLTVKGSYVNSLWEGILLVQVVNTSDRALQLKLGDELAAAFFFASKATAREDATNTTSANFGKDWPQVLGRSIDPFIARGGHRRIGPALEFCRTARDIWRQNGASLSALSIAVLIAGVTYKGKEVLSVAERVTELKQRVDTLSYKTTLSGVALIEVPKGANSANKEIGLERSIRGGFAIARSLDPLYNDVTAIITQEGSGSKLNLHITTPFPVTNAMNVEVRWAIIP